jgi:Ni/Co efflux regulator RcnB
MRNNMLRLIYAPMLLVSGMLATGTALAEKPAHAGGGKESKQAPRDERGGAAASQRGHDQRPARATGHAAGPSAGGHFNEHHRIAVHSYYDEQFHRGRCPAGLAKKNNGCMPPGLAKRWTVGRTLPGDVVFHDLPLELVTVLGIPPAGHRYVRVARDILLITVGTGMVVAGLDGLLEN